MGRERTSELRPEGQEGSSHRKSRGRSLPSRGESRLKDHVAGERLIVSNGQEGGRSAGEDERAGCHIREDSESPEGSLDFVLRALLQFSKSMHGMVHIFSNHLATELQIGLRKQGSQEAWGVGGRVVAGRGKGECSSRNPSKSSCGWGQAGGRGGEEGQTGEVQWGRIDRICC